MQTFQAPPALVLWGESDVSKIVQNCASSCIIILLL
nr:MAG TPA: hypothetical protein [Caudoviricetes sp.]